MGNQTSTHQGRVNLAAFWYTYIQPTCSKRETFHRDTLERGFGVTVTFDDELNPDSDAGSEWTIVTLHDGDVANHELGSQRYSFRSVRDEVCTICHCGEEDDPRELFLLHSCSDPNCKSQFPVHFDCYRQYTEATKMECMACRTPRSAESHQRTVAIPIQRAAARAEQRRTEHPPPDDNDNAAWTEFEHQRDRFRLGSAGPLLHQIYESNLMQRGSVRGLVRGLVRGSTHSHLFHDRDGFLEQAPRTRSEMLRRRAVAQIY